MRSWGISGCVVRSGAASHRCRRAPAAAQRLVQAHMVGAQVGAGAGHAVLRAELRALGFEHGLEVDQPAAVALACQQRGVAGGLGGAAAGAPGARGRRAARPARPLLPSAPSAPWPRRPRAPGPARPAARAPGRVAAPPSNTGIDTLASSAADDRTRRWSACPASSARRPSEPPSWKFGARAASACDTRAMAAVTWCSAARTSGRWRSVSAGMLSARSSAACGTGPGRGQHRRQGRRRLAGQHRERMAGLLDGWSAAPATGRASARPRRAPARLRAR